MLFASIFISYSHKDRKILRFIELQSDLKNAAFIDSTHTPRGVNWKKHHENAICRAHRFVLLWSKNASQSRQVEREWRLAQSSQVKIIPVLIDETPLPDELKALHAISLVSYMFERDYYVPAAFLKHLEKASEHGEIIGVACMFLGIGAIGVLLLILLSKGWTFLQVWFLVLTFIVSLFAIYMGAVFFAKGRRWSRLREKITSEVILELKNWRTDPSEIIGDEELVKKYIEESEEEFLERSRKIIAKPVPVAAGEKYVYKPHENNKPEIEAVVDDLGWVTCPNCRRRFATYSQSSWVGHIHATCGQKIKLINPRSTSA